MSNNAVLVITTTGTEQQAITIAEELIQQELAACINILSPIRSIYRFRGKIFDDVEQMLVIKTTAGLYDEVAQAITQLHTYEIPEIICVDVGQCKDNFLQWLTHNVKAPVQLDQTIEPVTKRD